VGVRTPGGSVFSGYPFHLIFESPVPRRREVNVKILQIHRLRRVCHYKAFKVDPRGVFFESC